MTRFMWIGLAVWAVITVAIRVVGRTLLSPGIWSIVLVLAVVLTGYAVDRLTRTEQRKRRATIVLLGLPILFDVAIVAAFDLVFPNLDDAMESRFITTIASAYLAGLATMFIPPLPIGASASTRISRALSLALVRWYARRFSGEADPPLAALESLLGRAPGWHTIGLLALRRRAERNAYRLAPSTWNVRSTNLMLGERRGRLHQSSRPTKDTLVYFHGGGFVSGSLDSHDAVCRALCAKTGASVVAVDYRLAPEHRFPAAISDARAAVVSVFEHAPSWGGDADSVGVVGESAGGALAAVVAQEQRHRIALQALVYPMLALEGPPGAGPGLSRADLDWCVELYAAPAERREPSAAPGLSPALGGLPPAIVVIAGRDVLAPEAADYAERMREAGVDVTVQSHPALVHGSMLIAGVSPMAARALDELATAIRDVFRSRAKAAATAAAATPTLARSPCS